MALRGGREDDDVREENESAALSGGREEEEHRDVNESVALSEDDLDEGRGASESATLNEGRGTRDDFLAAGAEADAGELAAECGARGARPECLLSLVTVMEKEKRMTYFATVVTRCFYPSRHCRIDARWASHMEVMELEGETGEYQVYRSEHISVMVARQDAGENQGDHS